jgi:polysaccharide pyruvyl transferase WcaK-like protein
MSKQVALIGATCWGNRGAEAMLATSVGVIRERFPGTRFVVLSYYPDRDRQLIQSESVKVYDARPSALVLHHLPFALCDRLLRSVGLSWPSAVTPAAVLALRESNVLVDLGGISFADGRALYLPFNVLCVFPAMLLGVPVIKLAQAMGPFNRWPTRLAAKLFLSRCRHVVARGRRTLDNLKDVMPPGRVTLAADVAFAYRPEFTLSHENDARVMASVEHLTRNGNHRVVGLSPSMVVRDMFTRRGRDYIGLLVQLATLLVDRGFHLVVLPNATRADTHKPKNNDLIVIAELRRRLANDWPTDRLAQVTWVDFDVNTHGIRRLVSCCEVLVTSRFHAMIAAVSTQTPVLVVGWSHKYVEVLEAFGLQEYVANPETSSQQVAAMLDKLLLQAGSVSQRMAQMFPDMRESALRQFDVLETVLA